MEGRKREREGKKENERERKSRKSQIRPMWLGHSEQEVELYQEK